MPNFHSGTVTAAAPANASVGTSSSEVVAENLKRVGMVLTNVSDSTIYLGMSGNAAVLKKGIALVEAGGVWTMDEYNYTKEAVNAIADTAGSFLAIQEFLERS